MSKLVHKLVCITCGKEFEGKKIDSKNCSKECRVKSGHIKRKQVNDEKLAKKMAQVKPRPCKVCQGLFVPHKAKIDIQVYCGDVCQGKDMHVMRTQKPGYKEQRAAYKREWYTVNTKEKRYKMMEYSYKTRYDGNYILCLERDNYTCITCGETDRYKLHVHHKDHSGKKKNPNHSLDNLETLCNSCHMKHHQSEENNVQKFRIPDEDMLKAIESSSNSRKAADNLGVSVWWLREWKKKNKSLLKPLTCPICGTQFPPKNNKRFCSPTCAYEDKLKGIRTTSV